MSVILRFAVKTYIERLECHGLDMVPEMTLASDPPKWVHRCHCGAQEIKDERYPRMIYEETDTGGGG